MTQSIRTAWQITRSSIYALTIRNLEQRFIMHGSNKRLLDLLRIFFEPFGHIILWTTFKLFKYQTVNGGINPALFILLGVLPWLFTLNTLGECAGIVSNNKGLLVFKQIKPMDAVFALIISEFGSLVLVCCCSLILFSILGWSWQIHNLSSYLLAAGLYLLFITGLGLFVACVSFFSLAMKRFLKFITRLLYFSSGIFFSAQMVPAHLRALLLWNPLFQVIEISRESFSDVPSYPLFGDIDYLFKCALFSITIGLSTYVLVRKHMMIKIMEY